MITHDHYLDEQFMLRALELAQAGRGLVSPNPLVGSVIVYDGRIVGEGWHKQYGGPHAEVNAVNSVADKNVLAESTIYVNLEPCSHVGKTPPCADMLVERKLKRVVIANLDTNPLVSGRGVTKLQAAGIDVTTGILEGKGRELNKRFFTAMEKRRPYIILKWAQTADGFLAREDGDSKWISNELSRQLVHKWRTEEDAVLVGRGTVMYDNPRLNVRDWSGRNPVRVVVDRSLKLSGALHVFDGTQKTILYNTEKEGEDERCTKIRLSGKDFLKDLVSSLLRQKIQSIIIEGGAQILNAFLESGFWDEARVFTSHNTFHKGLPAPTPRGNLLRSEMILNDTLEYYVPG